jgi:hypothetical protein
MSETARMNLLDKIMLAGIAQFAGVIALDTIILVSTRQFFPGTAGGGDALLMVLLPILSYMLSCVVLVPCILYRLYQRLRGQIRLTPVQTLLAGVGVTIIAAPPVVINLLPFFR